MQIKKLNTMKYELEILNKMANVPENSLAIQYLKKGGIHIKKENRGKFTAAAKRAGKSVQEYARDVLNNPNATTLQKRRANFARNAKKWKHQDGGTITKPSFEEWIAMIPSNKVDLSPNSKYNYRLAYELAPWDQLEDYALRDGHLYSAYLDPSTGIYEFAKRKDHDTIDMELDFYYGNTPDSWDFRRQYFLDTSGDYYRYIPRNMVPHSWNHINNFIRPTRIWRNF